MSTSWFWYPKGYNFFWAILWLSKKIYEIENTHSDDIRSGMKQQYTGVCCYLLSKYICADHANFCAVLYFLNTAIIQLCSKMVCWTLKYFFVENKEWSGPDATTQWNCRLRFLAEFLWWAHIQNGSDLMN